MTPAGRLTGKRAAITGGASGIGRAAALRLAAEGAQVAILDRDEGVAARAVADIVAGGGIAHAVAADVADETSISTALAAAAERWGGLDTVVVNAGVELNGLDAAVHELELEHWRTTLDINLTGAFLTSKYAVLALLDGGGGTITLTGSPTGIYGVELGCHAYSASKGGLHGLARVMANEYADRGIRVNVVVPGVIDTPMNEDYMASTEGAEDIARTVPLRRAGRPEEIASMIAFLASDDASYAVGGLFTVDGGLTAI